MDVTQELTKEQEKKRDGFYNLMNKIQLSQRGFSSQENDLLKATYSVNEEYEFIFKSREDNVIYQAIFKDGALNRITPKNEKLFNELNADTDLSDSRKYEILDISNSVKRMEQSITARLNQRDKESIDTLYKEFQEILSIGHRINEDEKYKELLQEIETLNQQYQVSPSEKVEKEIDQLEEIKSSFELNYSKNSNIEIQKKLESFHEKLTSVVKSENELVSILSDYIDKTENVIGDPNISQGNEQEIILDLDHNKNRLETSITRLNDLERLQELTNVLSNINYQSIRDQYNLNELYKDTNIDKSSLELLEGIDSHIPFQKGFEQRLSEELKINGESFALSLAVNHQITDPKEKLKLHLMNYNNIQEFIQQPYQPLNKEDIERLRGFSYESLEKAVDLINDELSKNHTNNIRLNRSIFVSPDATEERQKSYDKLFQNLRPVSMLQDKEINLMNIHEISAGYGSRVSDYWHKEILNAVNNYVTTKTGYTKEGTLEEVDKSIQVLSLKGLVRTPIQSQELNKNLEVINDVSNTLETHIEHLESLKPDDWEKESVEQEINEAKEMKAFLEGYYEHVVENVLTDKEKTDVVQSIVSEVDKQIETEGIEVEGVKKDSSKALNPDYEQLLKRIAELEKLVDGKEKRSIAESLSESMKTGVKSELEKMHSVISKIGEQIQEIKNNIKQFTYGKVESVYKIANKTVDALDKRVQGIKKNIEKELEEVQEKINETPKEKEKNQVPKEVEIER
ncbi:hypothetical protein [Bacillus subtilis]|uniref:hypothetical protein n=1 Tax=Bacillus subtilis TaxID=1423 RepID=UPI001B93862A|nr:hypothetical protein [Bacillus subtilis]CAI6330588.1 hypothetical protein NRS6096_21860 [Bacillus subtilis]